MATLKTILSAIATVVVLSALVWAVMPRTLPASSYSLPAPEIQTTVLTDAIAPSSVPGVSKVVSTAYLNWSSNARGESQSPVYPEGSDCKERAKSMLAAFGFDQRHGLSEGYGFELFGRVSKRHGIKIEMLICVAKADSMLGSATKTKNNIGNVGNNDRGARVAFKDIGAGIDAIGRTLNNRYLAHKTSIGSLTPYGGGNAPYYATSPTGNWYNNVRNCIAEITNDPTVNPDWGFRY